jgi:hypothetical protein
MGRSDADPARGEHPKRTGLPQRQRVLPAAEFRPGHDDRRELRQAGRDGGVAEGECAGEPGLLSGERALAGSGRSGGIPPVGGGSPRGRSAPGCRPRRPGGLVPAGGASVAGGEAVRGPRLRPPVLPVGPRPEDSRVVARHAVGRSPVAVRRVSRLRRRDRGTVGCIRATGDLPAADGQRAA